MSTQPDKTLGQIAAEKLLDEAWLRLNRAQINFIARIIDSVAQAQPVKSLEEIAREQADIAEEKIRQFMAGRNLANMPMNPEEIEATKQIILRACQAAVRANRE